MAITRSVILFSLIGIIAISSATAAITQFGRCIESCDDCTLFCRQEGADAGIIRCWQPAEKWLSFFFGKGACECASVELLEICRADDVWRAADIIPIFANGNSDPLCSTTGSPGSYKNVIGVGSTSESNKLSSFSSKGPVDSIFGFFGRIKPDLSAPGEAVYSAWHTSDTAYNTISGTSMAAPHVAGATGLMFAANKNLSYDKVYEILRKGKTTTGLTPPLIRCSGSIFTRYSYPNNDFEQGLLNALNSVKQVQTQG